MVTPSFEEVKKYAKDYSVIPICKEIYADLATPITLLRRIVRYKKDAFLLESIEGGEKWARYSFLGFDPKARIYCKDSVVTIEGEGAAVIKTPRPLEVLRKYMQRYQAPKFEHIPPFTGGLVGYYGYHMIAYSEPALKLQNGDCNDFDLLLADKVIAYDHLKQKITVIVNMKTDNLTAQYEKALDDIQRMIDLITESSPFPILHTPKDVQFTCGISFEQYRAMIEKTKRHIYDGDIFQAVISRRFEAPYEGSLLNAYRVLRTTNPSPYMVYLSINGCEIISTSPETLVRLKNGRLSTFPIAGSRPRGVTEEEDHALEAALLQDEKELAEHNMLVDLGRNDIGKIAKTGSVKVTEYMQIHRYSKIMHICSEVQGDLCSRFDAFDAIEALLPAGTLSGAPKIRACEMINALEPHARGVYGGAIGYVDFGGNMDTCIAIRMAVRDKGRVYVQAGAGIVADSIPENEYAESFHKAKAVMDAVRCAADVDRY